MRKQPESPHSPSSAQIEYPAARALPKAPPLRSSVDEPALIRHPDDPYVPRPNRSAIASLVLSISALAVSGIPAVTFYLDLAVVPLAVIFGIIGMVHAKKLDGRGYRVAAWGVYLGGIALPVVLGAIFLVQ